MPRHRERDGDDRVLDQLGPDLRADRFGAAIVPAAAQLRAHLGDRGLLRLLAAFLLRQADQHGVRIAEGLQRHLADTEAAETPAQVGQIRRLRRAHFHQDAAGEIDAEIQPLDEHQPDRRQRHDHGEHEGEPVPAHEVDARVGRNQMNRLPHDRRPS